MYKVIFISAMLATCCIMPAFADDVFTISVKGASAQRLLQENITFTESGTYRLTNCESPISGLSIDVDIRRTSPQYLVRVLLKDTEGKEYLVMESFRELRDENSFSLTDYCEETALLDGIFPDSIKVFVKNATVTVNGIHVVQSSESKAPEQFKQQRRLIREQQSARIAERINEYNERTGKLWRAEATDLSMKEYSVRKRVLGFADEDATGGFEYYGWGIFEAGEPADAVSSSRNINRSEEYVESFDWRNRHGKNWMTSVKDQGESSYCVAFAINGCLEALTRLYFNRMIEIDLSELELARCCFLPDINWNPYYDGLSYEYCFNRASGSGVHDESANPFHDLPNETADCVPQTYSEHLTIYDYHHTTTYENDIKEALMTKGPLVSGYQIGSDGGHAMTLVGFGTIKAGDVIYQHNGNNLNEVSIHVGANNPHIGETYWIFKNSYGAGEYSQGYVNILFSNPGMMDQPYYVELPITSYNYTSSDIVCEDADGDGYYFWGIGPKPANYTFIPDDPDGDDHDGNVGPMDNYGFMKNLNPDDNPIQYVDNEQTLQKDGRYVYHHTVVRNNGILHITGDNYMYKNSYLLVQGNGRVIISNGFLNNAKIILQNNARLDIEYGGQIELRDGESFVAPVGTTVNIEEGRIEQFDADY